MAKLSTNLMSSDHSINVYSKDSTAHLRIYSQEGGFSVDVVDEGGNVLDAYETENYTPYPESVEVGVSYEVTVSAYRSIDIEFSSREDYELYKADPAEYIRANEIIQLYSTSDAIDDADNYEIEDASITEVEEL